MSFTPGLGISDFRKLREAGADDVDKTDFIRKILADPTQAVLFPRPRRFGKTINLSALRYFVEKRPEDLSALFQDLAVWKDPAARAHFQRYPVLFLTFKDIRADTWESTLRSIRILLQELCREHRYLLTSDRTAPDEVVELSQILRAEITEEQAQAALKLLSALLHRHHGEKVVLLIDEHDTPIHSGFLRGFHDDVVRFFRNFLSGAFKDNPALQRGVLTGILRVSRESLFSGLNNVVVHSILGREHATSFGFTEAPCPATRSPSTPGCARPSCCNRAPRTARASPARSAPAG